MYPKVLKIKLMTVGMNRLFGSQIHIHHLLKVEGLGKFSYVSLDLIEILFYLSIFKGNVLS